jgi:hypothetical protein
MTVSADQLMESAERCGWTARPPACEAVQEAGNPVLLQLRRVWVAAFEVSRAIVQEAYVRVRGEPSPREYVAERDIESGVVTLRRRADGAVIRLT